MEHDPLTIIREALPAIAVGGRASRMVGGHSGESWRVASDAGELVVKIRRSAIDAAKLESHAQAAKLARAAGVPTPEILFAGNLRERPIVIHRYVPGEDAEAVVAELSERQRADLFFAIGDAVARVHGVALPSFTERIGAPQAALASWAAVVERAAAHAARRNRTAGVLAEHEISMIEDRIVRAAADVSDVVGPALTHRDLYLANVLVDEGRFAALIDFELAKGWDPAFDFIKLGNWMFERYPDSSEPFMAGYRERAAPMAMATERLSVSLALEHFIALPTWAQIDSRELREVASDQLRSWLGGQCPAWLARTAVRLRSPGHRSI
jgi:aminoglycoside phosphotransferase (APT) family kinase protein